MPKVLEVLSKSEYAAFYEGYLKKVSYGDLVTMLIDDLEKQLSILENIPEEDFSFRYQINKWSLAELLVHLCDSEAVFSYRALTFSRNDKSSLPGMEQDEWVENSNANNLSKKEIIGLFKTCRNHTIALYKSFDDEQLLRIGTASKSLFSVRALAFIILGHNKHHFEIINKHYLTK